jgi:23S rRNA pseudouridine1911/1915/1917 synthase
MSNKNLGKIEVIFEDENYLVSNKPAGLVVHSDGRTEEETVAEWAQDNYSEIKGVGEPLALSDGRIIERPGIVHRIDRETSGVLVIAKNQESFLSLKEQFKEGSVSKSYNAFVYGEVKLPEDEEFATIDRPIGKSKKDFRLWSAQRGAKGKIREAITEYKVVFASPEVSYLEIYPRTGRTHQIRVHFKAINHPVVADKLYAPKREPILQFERLALHAKKITFRNLSGDELSFEAPYPADFQKALESIGINS